MRYGTKTLYKGCTLRSLHELAWGEYLDAQSIPWEYEAVKFRDPNAPAGLGYSYTPDFALDNKQIFLEIKSSFAQHINKLHFCTSPLLYIVGLPTRPAIHIVQNGAFVTRHLTDFDIACRLAKNGLPTWIR